MLRLPFRFVCMVFARVVVHGAFEGNPRSPMAKQLCQSMCACRLQINSRAYAASADPPPNQYEALFLLR